MPLVLVETTLRSEPRLGFFPKQNPELATFNLFSLKKELQNWPSPFPNEYLSHQEDVLLDNINLLYVAMTRHKDRLYIITNSDNRKGSIYKYFYDYSYFKNMTNLSWYFYNPHARFLTCY